MKIFKNYKTWEFFPESEDERFRLQAFLFDLASHLKLEGKEKIKNSYFGNFEIKL